MERRASDGIRARKRTSHFHMAPKDQRPSRYLPTAPGGTLTQLTSLAEDATSRYAGGKSLSDPGRPPDSWLSERSPLASGQGGNVMVIYLSLCMESERLCLRRCMPPLALLPSRFSPSANPPAASVTRMTGGGATAPTPAVPLKKFGRREIRALPGGSVHRSCDISSSTVGLRGPALRTAGLQPLSDHA